MADEIKRMRLLEESATAIKPDGLTAMPAGVLKVAFVPAPSENPATLFPARVVTTPPGVMRRIL